METERNAAQESLDAVSRVQQSAVGDDRPFAWLTLVGAAFASAYVGIWIAVTTLSLSVGFTSAAMTLLPTILLYTGLVTGSRERFSVRTRTSIRDVVVIIPAMIAFLVFALLSLAGVTYPWWLGIVVGGALFAGLGGSAIVKLVSSPRPASRSTPWRSEPLSRPARTVTALVGVALGVVVALAPFPMASSIATVVILLLVIMATVTPGSKLSLASTGFEWGAIHWVGFGIAVAIVYATTLLFPLTTLGSPLGAILCGVVTAAALVIAAFLPRAPR